MSKSVHTTRNLSAGSRPLKDLLFISYFFPPIGGPPVQRNVKYVKYLPHFGWRPHVLTVKSISYHVYDQSLLGDIPSEAVVVRTGSLDPLRVSSVLFRRSSVPFNTRARSTSLLPHGSLRLRLYRSLRDVFAFPDIQVGWIPFAVRKGLQLIRRRDVQVVVARNLPFSCGIAANLLSNITGTPYVLDLADGWLDDPHLRLPTGLHRRAHSTLEKRILCQASCVTVYGDELLQSLTERYPELDGRIHVLTNGFDPDDFTAVTPQPRRPGQRRIVYMGSLYEHHAANLSAFLAALKSIPEDLRQTLQVVVVGQTYSQAPALVRQAGLQTLFQFVGYLPHTEALGYLASADAALLFVQRGDHSMVTGKLFEYFGMGLPILACIETTGACARVLRQVGQEDWIAPADDPARVAQALVSLEKANWPRPDSSRTKPFNRREITKKLADILDHVAQERRQRALARQLT